MRPRCCHFVSLPRSLSLYACLSVCLSVFHSRSYLHDPSRPISYSTLFCLIRTQRRSWYVLNFTYTQLVPQDIRHSLLAFPEALCVGDDYGNYDGVKNAVLECAQEFNKTVHIDQVNNSRRVPMKPTLCSVAFLFMHAPFCSLIH